MRNYWSSTKFSDIIRGTKSLEYGTSMEWKVWRERAKKAHPIRYWIAEELLDKVQDVVYYPIDKAYNIKYWFLNRFVTKTHTLTSILKRGEYWEYDTRIIHCLFDELVNFVEIEKAWMQVCWNDEDRTKYKVPGYALGWFRTRTWRCPEAGIDYLIWESTDPELIGTPQAEAARQILELYHWWKNERPKRIDPMDASGWTEYCHNHSWDDEKTEEEQEESMKIIHETDVIETGYTDEDTKMLIKLIKLRNSLWT